jgi:hypothetical protein
LVQPYYRAFIPTTSADGLRRLHEYRRDERESLQPILRRLVAIERALGLREKIEVPQATRRRPLGT